MSIATVDKRRSALRACRFLSIAFGLIVLCLAPGWALQAAGQTQAGQPQKDGQSTSGSQYLPVDHQVIIEFRPEPEGPKAIGKSVLGSSSEAPTLVVILRAVFSSDAKVRDIKVVKMVPKSAPKVWAKDLARKAIEAAKGIKFIPATKDARPVSMYMQLEYTFTLDDEDDEAGPKN